MKLLYLQFVWRFIKKRSMVYFIHHQTFFNSSLFINFTWFTNHFLILNTFSFFFRLFYLPTRFQSQNISKYWGSDINVNKSMHIVPFSFCWIYSFLSMFLYDLDFAKVTLLSLLPYQVINPASNNANSNSQIPNLNLLFVSLKFDSWILCHLPFCLRVCSYFLSFSLSLHYE